MSSYKNGLLEELIFKDEEKYQQYLEYMNEVINGNTYYKEQPNNTILKAYILCPEISYEKEISFEDVDKSEIIEFELLTYDYYSLFNFHEQEFEKDGRYYIEEMKQNYEINSVDYFNEILKSTKVDKSHKIYNLELQVGKVMHFINMYLSF